MACHSFEESNVSSGDFLYFDCGLGGGFDGRFVTFLGGSALLLPHLSEVEVAGFVFVEVVCFIKVGFDIRVGMMNEWVVEDMIRSDSNGSRSNLSIECIMVELRGCMARGLQL